MGGNVFGTTASIKREDIKPTLLEFFREFKKIFPKAHAHFTGIKTIGSVGKKEISGDIDLVLAGSSFDDIDDWMYERDMKCKSNFCTLIIGTKSDIKKKDLITDDMISELCIKYNASYIETSAKYDINIVDAFKLICKKLIEKNNPSYNSFKSSIIQNHNKKINCCLLS